MYIIGNGGTAAIVGVARSVLMVSRSLSVKRVEEAKSVFIRSRSKIAGYAGNAATIV